MKNSNELKDYLGTIYSIAAQYNKPPRYPVTVVCGGIDGAPKGTDILDRVFAGLVAYRGNKTCYDPEEFISSSETRLGWSWQVGFNYLLASISYIKTNFRYDFYTAVFHR